MDYDPDELLNTWKSRVLRPSDLPFGPAVRSLFSRHPQVEVRPQTASRWTFYAKGTDDVAVFSHCCTFAMSDNYETGNLVPKGAEIPDGMPEDRIERHANFRCNYGYAFDTSNDRSLYDLQQMLDDHMRSIDEFNPDRYVRREYQSGNDATFMRRFWMRTPMFLQVSKGEAKPPAAVHLHRWVAEAARRSTAYYANPARPTVLALEDGALRDIRKTSVAELYRGDIVVVTFTVSYVVAGTVWYPQFLPLEIVRVGEAPQGDAAEAGRYAVPVVDTNVRPTLADGEILGDARNYSDRDRSNQASRNVRSSGGGTARLHGGGTTNTMKAATPSEDEVIAAGQFVQRSLGQRKDVVGAQVPTSPSLSQRERSRGQLSRISDQDRGRGGRDDHRRVRSSGGGIARSDGAPPRAPGQSDAHAHGPSKEESALDLAHRLTTDAGDAGRIDIGPTEQGRCGPLAPPDTRDRSDGYVLVERSAVDDVDLQEYEIVEAHGEVSDTATLSSSSPPGQRIGGRGEDPDDGQESPGSPPPRSPALKRKRIGMNTSTVVDAGDGGTSEQEDEGANTSPPPRRLKRQTKGRR